MKIIGLFLLLAIIGAVSAETTEEEQPVLVGGPHKINAFEHVDLVCEIYDELEKMHYNLTKVIQAKIQVVSGIKFWLDVENEHKEVYSVEGMIGSDHKIINLVIKDGVNEMVDESNSFDLKHCEKEHNILDVEEEEEHDIPNPVNNIEEVEEVEEEEA